MKILVFDVPASEGGALSVLADFFKYVEDCPRKDIKWVFIVSTNDLGEPKTPSRIKIERYPSVKRGWFSRILFELFCAPKLVRKHSPDVIFSLQNTAILFTAVPQVVYVHQSIPYAPTRFSYADPHERKLAIIGDIFRPIIGWSIGRSRAAIVQTGWLRDAIEKEHNIAPGKVHVVPQAINIQTVACDLSAVPRMLFYPAAAYIYKGFEEIISAVEILITEGYIPKVILTINGSENAYAHKLVQRIKRCGLGAFFRLEGRITRDQVFALYHESALLFTSRLESFGLPLLEARLVGTPIIATSQPFSREILNGYARAHLVSQGDVEGLAEEMKRFCIKRDNEASVESVSDNIAERIVQYNCDGGWNVVLELIAGMGD
ncbi:MAG: hypothetical protein A2Z96_08015 [Spirochaetes bacterium GWB1_48_6]|nr:MAG: hypothetical protein A2Z96_08015 [Spirochaetes bacterium GWB1_48_6]